MKQERLRRSEKKLVKAVPFAGHLKIFNFSLIYFAEKDAVAKWTFLDSFWWGLMVLTTVGYGAKAPHTMAGQASFVYLIQGTSKSKNFELSIHFFSRVSNLKVVPYTR